ncbi:MAG: 1,4-dihydroxy-6-naphthoate synthase [Deltaproteobacteria bacterium]|jgi:1,4-dihydroxy-6-naphthoate synthase|nr:1,4-dihydroxy-6-naphthoate synthase [Deltaproteobacteria bacterium]
MKSFSIGFSPCPNDTYIFCGLVNGYVPLDGWSLQPVYLEDVETLNEWALEGRLDITKLSFHAFGHVLDKYVLLKSGGALGRGCGPLLVGSKNIDQAAIPEMTVAVPGKYTTAAMLLKLYEPGWKKIVMMRFDKIMPAIETGEVDYGVIIHESRFTYSSRGLILIKDLGSWWEEISGYPIPLGGIAAKRSLGRNQIERIDNAIKESISWAHKNRPLCRPYIKKHAQELDDSVINDHIGLYVNTFSENLGEEGLAAIRFFLQKGCRADIFSESADNIQKISY